LIFNERYGWISGLKKELKEENQRNNGRVAGKGKKGK
jgi:hypothetical protein